MLLFVFRLQEFIQQEKKREKAAKPSSSPKSEEMRYQPNAVPNEIGEACIRCSIMMQIGSTMLMNGFKQGMGQSGSVPVWVCARWGLGQVRAWPGAGLARWGMCPVRYELGGALAWWGLGRVGMGRVGHEPSGKRRPPLLFPHM